MSFWAQQTSSSDSLVRQVEVEHDVMENTVEFTPETPPLIQVAGAPKAYYSYYWEFGDGHFSKDSLPKHVYEKPGEYEAQLWVTNHYDNGKTPATRPQKVKVNKATTDYKEKASMTSDIDIIRNRDPIPEEDIVVVMRYKNPKNYTTSGQLYLFYNEQKYKADNFELTDIRTHHGEQQKQDIPLAFSGVTEENETLLASAQNEILQLTKKWKDSTEKINLPLTLEESKAYYRDYQFFEFDDMQPGEERNMFFTLRTTPEMLKDTSAIVTVRSVYVPDRQFDTHKVKDMEMEIVTSHDPNKMSSNATVMNYRLARFKTFKFKTKFQNNGEGPATTIRLETEIPEMFDTSSIEILDTYPECPICPKNKEVFYSCIDTTFTRQKAIFTFKKIYLPGTEQKSVTEIDSTKGFVKYKIKLAKDFHKKTTRTRTDIYFDKNDPITTNYATTRFLPGLSIGAKAGYIMSPSLNNHEEYFVGATFSPYKSYRGYLQAELIISANSFDELNQFTEETPTADGFVEIYDIEQFREHQNISFYLVPASYRYNLNNVLALGTGVQLKLDLSSEVEEENTGEYSLFIPSEGFTIRDETKDFTSVNTQTTSLDNFQAGAFVGFNIGVARIGPSAGVRYVYNLNAPHNQLQFYAIWKF
ncbi:PKD domain-containing protein [Psychroflexus salinarum]|uniref:PKD domain-containing protein n=1 Tax=Psychroflexus salinarum TaxID=546024 RepID=A0ABW3GLR6_9FLAO